MSAYIATPAGAGPRGSVRGIVLIVLLVIAVLAGHYIYTQHKAKQNPAPVETADSTTESATESAAGTRTETEPTPTPTTNSTRIQEMEFISGER